MKAISLLNTLVVLLAVTVTGHTVFCVYAQRDDSLRLAEIYIKTGDLLKLSTLLTENPDIFCKNIEGYLLKNSLFHIAADYSEIDVLNLLLERYFQSPKCQTIVFLSYVKQALYESLELLKLKIADSKFIEDGQGNRVNYVRYQSKEYIYTDYSTDYKILTRKYLLANKEKFLALEKYLNETRGIVYNLIETIRENQLIDQSNRANEERAQLWAGTALMFVALSEGAKYGLKKYSEYVSAYSPAEPATDSLNATQMNTTRETDRKEYAEQEWTHCIKGRLVYESSAKGVPNVWVKFNTGGLNQNFKALTDDHGFFLIKRNVGTKVIHVKCIYTNLMPPLGERILFEGDKYLEKGVTEINFSVKP